jgi:hypothetical protein
MGNWAVFGVTSLSGSIILEFMAATELEHIKNVVYPGTPSATTCGYCSLPGQRSREATSYHSANLQAFKLSCSVR